MNEEVSLTHFVVYNEYNEWLVELVVGLGQQR